MWPALLKPALTRPARTLTISVLALALPALPALPALSLTQQSDSPAPLPRSIAATHTHDRLSTSFPSKQSTLAIVVRASADDGRR